MYTSPFLTKFRANRPDFSPRAPPTTLRAQAGDFVVRPARDDIRPIAQDDVESRFALLRLHSAVAARMFADGFFDFIYIDAEHTYGMVSQDIRLWWPKVRPGGILAVHDYTAAGETSEVCRAVDRFVMQEGLTLYLTECDFVSEANGAKVRSWLVERP